MGINRQELILTIVHALRNKCQVSCPRRFYGCNRKRGKQRLHLGGPGLRDEGARRLRPLGEGRSD